jgi:Icc-related predicted phosphoesterase
MAAADPHGSARTLEQLGQVAADRDVQAICLIGNLSEDGATASGYRDVFHTLGTIGLPAYWVPGPADAPVGEYLHEAYNMEVVFPFLHGVHGTASLAPDGHILFAGLGGKVGDDPNGPRDEQQSLTYPRWEAEYRMKVLRDFDEHQLVLMFATPPAHKRVDDQGSEVIAEMVKTMRPRVVLCGGERVSEMLGRTRVVAPGNMEQGQYAVVDVLSQDVEWGDLPVH